MAKSLPLKNPSIWASQVSNGGLTAKVDYRLKSHKKTTRARVFLESSNSRVWHSSSW